MKERLPHQVRGEVQQVLQEARRVIGKEPGLRRVDDLPHGTRAMLHRRSSPGRPWEILYRKGEEPVLGHLIAHEVGHLVRLHRVPEAERLMAAAISETRERAARQLLPELAVLLAQGFPGELLPAEFDRWYAAIVGQVVYGPTDLRIEQWVSNRFSKLHTVQRRSLLEEVSRNAPLLEPAVVRMTSPTIYRAQMAMNAAQACHVARLFQRPEVIEPFKTHGLADAGERLVQMVFEAPDEGHRSDMAAANRWAKELNLAGWFEWQPLEVSQ